MSASSEVGIVAKVSEEKPRKRQGRGPHEARHVSIRVGVVAQAHGKRRPIARMTYCLGSSLVSLGSTCVSCAVRLVARKSDVVQCEVESELLVDAERVRSAVAAALILDRLPKVSLSLKLVVISSDDATSATCACIIAASLALADAGVESLSLVAAAAAGASTDGQRFFVDPLPHEAQPEILVTSLGADHSTTILFSSSASGPKHPKRIKELALLAARAADTTVRKDMSDALRRPKETSAYFDFPFFKDGLSSSSSSEEETPGHNTVVVPMSD